MNDIVLFLTTGRCGTQWLARHLGDVYADAAAVTHEPLGPLYRPRRFFRSYCHNNDQLTVPEIRRHLDRVEAWARDRLYVETGWPCFAAIPLFVERFGGRVRVVHLVRHPVPSALSHMVHQTYGGSPRDDGYTRHAALDPTCPNVFQDDYRERWPRLTPYEKTLFWWAEVHRYAEEFRSRFPHVPVTTVRSEDVFGPDDRALRRLVDFLGLAYDETLGRRRARREDRWRHRTRLDFDPRLILRHRLALDVARRLGYDPHAFDVDALEQRYKREGWDPAPSSAGRGFG